jgi:hypothetical protein
MRRASPLLALFSLLAACSSTSQATQPNGQVFDVDSGADSATDFLPDAHKLADARADHASSNDGGGHDAHAGSDATMMTKPDGGGDAHSGSDAALDGTGAPDVVDAGPMGADASVCPSGTGTIALVGGSSIVAFGAASTNGGTFQLKTFTNQTVSAPPAVIGYGPDEFLTAFPVANTDYIVSSLYSSGAWSTPAAIPAVAGSDASANEQGAPALALIGTSGELVYEGSNEHFYRGVFSGGMLGAASDAVGGAATQDFGDINVPPSAAVASSTLYVAYDGSNGGLYVDSWTSGGGWAGAQGVNGAGVGMSNQVPPTLIALNGGTADLMLVFVDSTTTPADGLSYVVHTPGTGWSTPAVIDATAFASNAVSLAPLKSGGGAAMVYLGGNGFAYGSTYDPTATPPWTTPALVYANSLPLQSPPTIAAGTCGVDAVAALVETTGVDVVTLKSGVWAPPVLVNTLAQMTYATIATSP